MFLVCKKGQKEDKNVFVNKSAGIIDTIIFMWRYLQITEKAVATQCFFTDNLNQKSVNKTTSANPCQLWEH